MIFGKSLFQSMLDKIEDDEQEKVPEEPASPRIRGLSSGFVVEQMEGVSAGTARIGDAYLDLQPEELVLDPKDEPDVEPPEPDVPVAPPPHLLRQTPAEIAEDLGLTGKETIGILQERRRTFALANHPDRIIEPHRALANQRMTTANLLIDKAIARLEAMKRLGLD